MKFIEVIIWFALLVIILGVWVNFLTWWQVKTWIYLNKLTKDSYRISLYNYSQILAEKTNDNEQWYISFSGDNFLTWLSGQFAYNCKKGTWDLIDINEPYTWIFCNIDFEWEKIYNYAIK